MNLEGLTDNNPTNSLHPSKEAPKIPTLKFKFLQNVNESEVKKPLSGRSFSKESSELIENKFFHDLKLLTGLVIKIFDEQESLKSCKSENKKKEETLTPRNSRLKDVIHDVVNALSPRERSQSLSEFQDLESPQKQILKILPEMLKKLVDIKNIKLIEQFSDQLTLIQEQPLDSALKSLVDGCLNTIPSLQKSRSYLESWDIVEKLPNNGILFLLKSMPTCLLNDAHKHFKQIEDHFESTDTSDTEIENTFKLQVNIILEKMKMLPHWISEQCLADILIGHHTDAEKFYDLIPFLGWLKEIKFIKKSIDIAMTTISILKSKNQSIDQPLCALISSLDILLKEKPFIWNLSSEDKKHFEHVLFSIQDLTTDQIDKRILEKIITIFEGLNTNPYIKAREIEVKYIEKSTLSETLDLKKLSHWIPDLVIDLRTYFSWHLSHINGFEFANEAWSQEKTKELTSPNILSLVLKYDNISYNVARHILSIDKPSGREIIIKEFCKLLEGLMNDKNYPAARAIFFGLDLLPLIRNSKTLTSDPKSKKIFDFAAKLFGIKSSEYEKDLEISFLLYKQKKLTNPPLLELGYFLKGFTALNAKEHRVTHTVEEKTLIFVDKVVNIKEKINTFNTIVEPIKEYIETVEGKEQLFKCEFFSRIIEYRDKTELDLLVEDLKKKAREMTQK